jgi:ABC-type branched-subunit amino acid transport system permease subunit
MVLITRTRLGKLLRALSESPVMLSTHGLTVTVTRVTVFTISAFFAGIAGALMISQTNFAGSSGFPAQTSLLLLAVLGICGTRLVAGSLVAAGLIALAPGYLTWLGSDQQELIFGLAAIVAVVLYAARSHWRESLTSAALRSVPRRAHSPVASRRRQRLSTTRTVPLALPAVDGSLSTPVMVDGLGQ